MKNRLCGALAACVLFAAAGAEARIANKTVYPIVFAHGMAGFNDILGYDYWGDDYGYYVLDPWQNWDIDFYQKSFVASVTPFQSSEQRGYERHHDAPIAELNPAVLEFQKLTIRKWEEYLAERDGQSSQRRLPIMPSAPHE